MTWKRITGAKLATGAAIAVVVELYRRSRARQRRKEAQRSLDFTPEQARLLDVLRAQVDEIRSAEPARMRTVY